MPDFSAEIDIYVDEFWSECSRSEKNELIDLLVEEGFVIRKTKQPDDPNRNLLDEEWDNLCGKLQSIRQRMSVDDEQTTKQIISKY